MKTLLFILIVCFSVTSTAQDIIKKANTVIITDSLSRDLNFKSISDLLYESGFGILRSDKETGTISTTEKEFKNGTIKLNILIKDFKITVRGDFKDNITLDLGGVSAGPSWSSIVNSGMKNSVVRNAWDEMIKFTSLIPGEKEYLIR